MAQKKLLDKEEKNMTDIKTLREKAKQLINQSEDNLTMRSCWKCNPAHNHLKKSSCVIWCFECGNYYYKGKKITEGYEN